MPPLKKPVTPRGVPLTKPFPKLIGVFVKPPSGVTRFGLLIPAKDRPNHPKFRILPASIRDHSFYRINPGYDVIGFMTVMPDGVELGWDTCGTCASHFRNCECPIIGVPGSVTWMLKRTGHWQLIGLAPDTGTPVRDRNYPTASEAPVSSRKPSGGTPTPPTRSKPSTGHSDPGTPLSKDATVPDTATLDEAAKDLAAQRVAQFGKALRKDNNS